MSESFWHVTILNLIVSRLLQNCCLAQLQPRDANLFILEGLLEGKENGTAEKDPRKSAQSRAGNDFKI